MQIRKCYDFDKQVGPQDLSPLWLALRAAIGKPTHWALLSQYAAYCTSLGIDPPEAGESRVAKFLEAFADSGRTYGPDRVLGMRKLIERLRSDERGLCLPPLAPNPPRAAPRKEQWRTAPPALRDDISKLVAICGNAGPSPSPSQTEEEAAKKRSASQDEKKRFLLRMIELAETALGRQILRLRELFENDVLAAIEAANYGETSGLPWDHSTNAIHTRSRLLELGRRYAYEILDDEDLGDALDDFLQGAEKHQKRRATLTPRDRDSSRKLDAPEKVRALVSGCRRALLDFGDKPNKRSYAKAQSALAIILQLATGRPPFKVRAATFSGPSRTMPARDERDVRAERPTLALPDPTLVNLEGQLTEETRIAIDAFWRGAGTLWGPDRGKAFATRSGNVKSDSAHSIGVTKFSKSCNLKLGPKAIQVGVVRGLINEDIPLQAVAEIIGVQQPINISQRFDSIIGATAPQRHADKLEQDGKLKK